MIDLKNSRIDEYTSLAKKEKSFFSKKKAGYYQVDTVDDFERLYKQEFMQQRNTDNRIYRGLQEAKYKLYNSAQRYWIQNQLYDWDKSKPSYIDMIFKMVEIAKKDELIKNAFNYYELPEKQRDFPILSILQHYGAPTPLMDWTYNPDVALFFATENVQTYNFEPDISNYFSIYYITLKEQNRDTKAPSDQLENILIWNNGIYPEIDKFKENEESVNFCLYLSEFGKCNKILAHFNLNIIAQRGVFIFTPLRNKPIEELFSKNEEDRDHHLIPFRCFNIHKSLAEYIRVKLKEKGITHNRLFPNLKINAMKIKSEFLAELL